MTEYVDKTELLQRKLEILRKNREMVSETMLRTKYKKSYQSLLKEISSLTSEVFEQEAMYLAVPEAFLADGKRIIQEFFTEDVTSKIKEYLLEQYSVEKFIGLCQEIKNRLCEKLFSGSYDFSSQERYTISGRRLV